MPFGVVPWIRGFLPRKARKGTEIWEARSFTLAFLLLVDRPIADFPAGSKWLFVTFGDGFVDIWFYVGFHPTLYYWSPSETGTCCRSRFRAVRCCSVDKSFFTTESTEGHGKLGGTLVHTRVSALIELEDVEAAVGGGEHLDGDGDGVDLVVVAAAGKAGYLVDELIDPRAADEEELAFFSQIQP